jgi:hypothetical protein
MTTEPTIKSLATKLAKMEVKLTKYVSDLKQSKCNSIDNVSTKKLKEKLKEKKANKNKEPRELNDYFKALGKARDAGRKQFTYVRNSKTEEGKKEKCIYKFNQKGMPKLQKVQAMD